MNYSIGTQVVLTGCSREYSGSTTGIKGTQAAGKWYSDGVGTSRGPEVYSLVPRGYTETRTHACTHLHTHAHTYAHMHTMPVLRADIWSCILAAATWTSRTLKAPWDARYGHTSVIDAAGAIYVIGGRDGVNFFSDVWVSTDGGATRTRGTQGVL
jgi:hypothetical protein